MISLRMTVDDTQVTAMMNRLKIGLSTEAIAAAMKTLIVPYMQKVTESAWSTKGRGGRWAPRKTRPYGDDMGSLLDKFGVMKQTLVNSEGEVVATGFAAQLTWPNSADLVSDEPNGSAGSENRFFYHQLGGGHVPQRRMVELLETDRSAIAELMHKFTEGVVT
jgi:hypothetical protein